MGHVVEIHDAKIEDGSKWFKLSLLRSTKGMSEKFNFSIPSSNFTKPREHRYLQISLDPKGKLLNFGIRWSGSSWTEWNMIRLFINKSISVLDAEARKDRILLEDVPFDSDMNFEFQYPLVTGGLYYPDFYCTIPVKKYSDLFITRKKDDSMFTDPSMGVYNVESICDQYNSTTPGAMQIFNCFHDVMRNEKTVNIHSVQCSKLISLYHAAALAKSATSRVREQCEAKDKNWIPE